MPTEPYVIVQDPFGVTGRGQPPGQVDEVGLKAAGDKFDGALVETADLTPREALAVDNSPNMVAAPVMPTRLIGPMQADADGNWATIGDPPAAMAASGGGGDSWGIAAINAGTSPYDGSGSKVAVLDTGIYAGHDAFAGVTITEQFFIGTGNGDAHGHGTHCAGTILGRDVGGRRIGIARGVTDLLVGKVLDDQGRGSSEALFKALNWAISEHADVISMSLGFDFPGIVANWIAQGYPRELAVSRGLVAYRQNLRAFDAIMGTVKAMAAIDAGAVVVAASGNESRAQGPAPYRIDASLPAAAIDVLAIAAAGPADANGRHSIAAFSNGAAQLTAPGIDILSAKAGTQSALLSMHGTSMACPHVAGVAALVWQKLRSGAPNGKADAKRVCAELSVTARNKIFTAGHGPFDFGDGFVSAPQ